ncbi:hypothetical protein [Streptomyces noursei]|uniref:Uncharacterized protein n=1 Tax=Streptomyces noursei TaxID=1971 RepID=A0A2N8PQX1_STRNR|nr:hypothetical protein [Streptomyces noursei]PNE43389.1 hypothetical protein AOB60_00115 [Streptomyces noursei]
MQLRIKIVLDDCFEPFGDPEVIAEETQRINAEIWAPYGVIVEAVGPVEREESVWGCVVPVTDSGAYRDLAAIQDDHLRDVATDLMKQIEESYLDDLKSKRDEIDALIKQMEVRAT